MCSFSYDEPKTWPWGQGTNLYFSEHLVVSAAHSWHGENILK